VEGPVSRSGIDLQVRIPNVVGMEVYEAQTMLRSAGYEVSIKFLDQPNRSFGPGQVSVQIPSGGTVQSAGKVELRVPLAATLVGIGTLNDQDIERRTGFDLDTGRLEEVTHGADLVLRHHDSTRALEPNGTAYYYGEGVYAEPSDGAIFVKLDSPTYQLGSYDTFAICSGTVEEARRSRSQRLANVQLPNGTNILGQVFCVETAEGDLAAVSFFDSDRGGGAHGDFIFHFAIFPRVPLATPHLPPRPLRRVTRP